MTAAIRSSLGADGVLLLEMAHGPVNAVALPLRRALLAAFEAADGDPQVKGVVLTGRDGVFSAGADLVEFDEGRAFDPPSFHADVLPFLFGLRKPVVAALNGRAIGGGLELALWCHARVARPDAPIGLPETTLALMPGAGGTQLLPRALGLERATTLIVSGAIEPASTFVDTPLIQALAPAPTLIDTARRLALALAVGEQPLPHLGHLAVAHPGAEGFLAFARSRTRARRDVVPGMLAAIDGIAMSLAHPALDGLRAEFELFRPLVGSPAARAVRHAFFAERRAPRVEGLAPPPAAAPAAKGLARALVVGAGYMGAGIAHCLAQAGIVVSVHDAQPGAAARCVRQLQAEPALAQARLAAVETLAEAADVDLVIEAVVEELGVKQALFRQLDEAISPHALFASNTSTLDLDAMAGVTRRPTQVIGLHFFGPAPRMRLLEVVRGARTSDDTLRIALALAQRMRKLPVVARVAPGFIANRIYASLMTEALVLVGQGIAPERIDSALEGFGWRMGPFRTMDLIGNDVLVKGRLPGATLSPGDRVQDLLLDLGRLGQKAGIGWYDYDPATRQPRPSAAVRALLPVATANGPAASIGRASGAPASGPMTSGSNTTSGPSPRSPAGDPQAIVERCMLALINEACRVLDDGIAQRASDIDLCFLQGYGFPRLRGGPLFHAMEWGLPVVRQKLESLLRETGDRHWQPSPWLARAIAADGRL